MKKNNEEFSIKELINIFLPRLWLIVIVALVFGACAAFYAVVLKDDTYTSTTRIHISKNTSGASDLGVSDVEFATFYLETYIELIKIPDFLEKVLKDFREGADYQAYIETVGSENLTGSSIKGYISTAKSQDILSISVTTPNPFLSYGLANSIQRVICDPDERVLAYPVEIVTPLTIQHPVRAYTPNSHREIFTTIIGLAVGTVFAMAIIFIINVMDVTVRDRRKLEDSFDVPVLGVIPRFISEEGKAKR